MYGMRLCWLVCGWCRGTCQKPEERRRSLGRRREDRGKCKETMLLALARETMMTVLLKITPSHNSHSSINNKTTALVQLVTPPPTLY
jgi:hypothetical protein